MNDIYPVDYKIFVEPDLDNITFKSLKEASSILFRRVIVNLIPLTGLGKESEVKEFFKNYMSKKDITKETIKMAIELMEINSRLRNVYFSSKNK